MKPKHQRLLFICITLICFVAASLMVMRAFRENLVYFYTPSDIAAQVPEGSRKIRVGGLVKQGTVQPLPAGETRFIITDGKRDLVVTYRGTLPNLFREGQGVIAEGRLLEGMMQMSASTILAKHDETYMPREVVDGLKRSGHWKDQYGAK